MIFENQIPKKFRDVISDQIDLYKESTSITNRNNIPDTIEIPLKNQLHWLRIPDVICVYVDMIDSTKLSAEKQDKTTASTYHFFTGTAVRLFHEFDSPYIDVRGDGVFALFDYDKPYTALAAAVTFKTFAENEFIPSAKEKTGVILGCHIGIDQKTVLVRKIGLSRIGDRTDRQNEVWAGKPVNMASKLASLTKNGELLVSERYFSNIQNDYYVLNSCGCPNGEKKPLWEKFDVSNYNYFDFESAYLLKSIWCKEHGKEYCEKILSLDIK